jgi:hypothetical protein
MNNGIDTFNSPSRRRSATPVGRTKLLVNSADPTSDVAPGVMVLLSDGEYFTVGRLTSEGAGGGGRRHPGAHDRLRHRGAAPSSTR